tara:strand:- start:2543 stop:3013 length:471 start_codon:yes stop_codon:yes gene_type:complete
MAFKLGKEKRGFNIPENGGIFKKKMNDGALGQANNDGSIDLDPSVDVNSIEGRGIAVHEQVHQRQMQSGRANYGDNWVLWEDKIYIRKTIDGQDVIDGPNGRWPDGHPNHPWEAEAVQAEESIKENMRRRIKEDVAKKAVQEKVSWEIVNRNRKNK